MFTKLGNAIDTVLAKLVGLIIWMTTRLPIYIWEAWPCIVSFIIYVVICQMFEAIGLHWMFAYFLLLFFLVGPATDLTLLLVRRRKLNEYNAEKKRIDGIIGNIGCPDWYHKPINAFDLRKENVQ